MMSWGRLAVRSSDAHPDPAPTTGVRRMTVISDVKRTGAPPSSLAPGAAGTDQTAGAAPQGGGTGPSRSRVPWWRRRDAVPVFLAADLGALALVVVATAVPLEAAAALAVPLVATAHALGMYRTRLTMSVLDDSPRILTTALVAVSVGSAFGAAIGQFTFPHPVPLVAVLVIALIASRTVAYRALSELRRRGIVSHPTLILGAGWVGLELANAMSEHPEHGLHPVGFIDADPLVPSMTLPAPILGGPDDLAAQIVLHRVDHVLIAFTATREIELVEAVRTCDRLQCEITVVSRLFELIPRTTHTDELHGMPLVRLRRAPFRSLTWPLKRASDVALSALALVVLSPILLLVTTLVRLVEGPGVLFRQDRVGIDGKAFELLKFRTLRPSDASEGDERWNVKGDERMSRLGAVLRRTCLDELPQLVNILRGDMSLVGPRPERPHFVAQFERSLIRYGDRHRVPSGLTGWAQIHGLRGDTSIEDRARLDNYYIENWSLWLDIKIILRTIPNLMKGSG
jgi:exopolysaccharide biosynthesis polyprenyl glycosylphosphotransferase